MLGVRAAIRSESLRNPRETALQGVNKIRDRRRADATRSPMIIDCGHSEPLAVCLRRLCRHLDLDAVALTGSVAITVHLAARGLPPHRRLLTRRPPARSRRPRPSTGRWATGRP